MIQDMFDPEIFLDQYCVKNLDSGKKKLVEFLYWKSNETLYTYVYFIIGEIRTDTCRYRDTTNIGPKEEPIEDRDLKHAERQSFYCISIPGKNSKYFSLKFKKQDR